MTNQNKTLSLFKDLVRFPSLSHEEKDIADYVASYIGRQSLAAQRVDNNVYVALGSGENCLLLNSHLDVVPPSESHPYPPFDATEKDGCIWGRGTVDAKASGTAMLRALVELSEEGWQPAQGKLIVALTTCEEVGGDYNGLQTLRAHLPTLSAALVGEPTELAPCIAQKGLLILKVNARGTSAHAARAHLGENAIYAAARDLLKLEHFSFEKTDPYLGKPTLAATTISGGKTRNMIPDLCTFYLDIRSTPAYSHEEIIALMSEYLESEVEVHSKRIVPAATKDDSLIVQACLKALPDKKPFGSPTTSDWIHLTDVPTVKIGPGPSQRSHTPHEHIEIDELLNGVVVYKRIIVEYFSNI
ncbi:MAG: M20/M25/M40 family metallo-hydrolase [Rhodothermales bacterium]